VGPIIPSPAARVGELDVSLLERLFNRDVYSTHPTSRKNMHHVGQGFDARRDVYQAPFTNLVKVSCRFL
jgi:hypothetical protein